MMERLQTAAKAERAELNGEHSALAEERECLKEGCKLLEAHFRAAKAVFNWDVEEVERLTDALAVECDAAVAERARAEEVMEELKG
ncbi:hypothetical protein E2562_031275 [Oryza meyeriana var. granulata]|uniref:Uncharacterized protein n=1 Tax=Oryza meyeriana var. granulata TaxID=110450 RepID=A0A6G1CAB4_9ORYZ|nr:hypothetical protein E2562_031275 [Oryza meyeriana var. granulata]